MLLVLRGTPRNRLFEYPHRADDSERYIAEAEATLDKILGLQAPVIREREREAWDEGARMAYDLASDDIGAWDVLHEFPDEFPAVAINPYKEES